jgi:hypothetical protein
MSRKRKKNPLADFPHEHPWMTFFLGLAAVNGIVTLVRGFPPALVSAPPPSAPFPPPGA